MGSTGIDIRFPIGLLFTILGVIIAAVGVVDPKASMSQGYNINLDWGIVLIVFGVIMLLLGNAAHRRRASSSVTESKPPLAAGAPGDKKP